MAEFMGSFDQPVTHGHAIVEYKTIPFPRAVFGRHLFKVTQDATFQVIDIFDPLAE